MTKFRWHRGGFAESMETAVDVTTLHSLKKVLEAAGLSTDNLTVKPYGGIDERNGWDTHIVSIDGNAVGFTDGMPSSDSRKEGNMKLNDLASDLAKTARVLDESDLPNSNPDLQAMVGDPDDFRTSTFVQFEPNPGNMQLPNPMSPIEGDAVFFAYMIPGAAFQALDGSQWNILDYPYQGMVHIENRWYPRLQGQVNLNDIRRSIEQWIEPIQQYVPAPPPGVDYGALLVKVTDGPTNYGRPDELSKGQMGLGKSDVGGGW